ncbi:MAG TPA: hypothetical protein VF631_04985 [Allosphingosinicella sp.]|jgi:hypothetical protein|uniref:glycosyltransferase n=1 Tax=Allosphingosinicella sp. TaxID=2823234 RepID=UPI002F27273F
MAHILLGWELGANRGHALTLVGISKALRARGHQISFAMQRVDALTAEQRCGSPVWQTPITPRLLISTSKPRTGAPATMGDILGRLGLDDADIVEALLRGWAQMLDAIQPDLVISDYGPFLLTAARQRCPTVSIGTGFGVPPSVMTSFPSLSGRPATHDEDTLLGGVNVALKRTGLSPLASLPGIFAAERELACSFAELDPYRSWRSEPLLAPVLGGGFPETASGGEEIFVYMPEQVQVDAPIWRGLAESKLPIRVYVSSVSTGYREKLASLGFFVEDKPLSFSGIAARSRLLLSHGGHGFVCSALLSGIPQVICHFDLEKVHYAKAVTGLSVGGMVSMTDIKPDPFARSLIDAYENEGLAGRALAAAPSFRNRCHRSMEESLSDAVQQLL